MGHSSCMYLYSWHDSVSSGLLYSSESCIHAHTLYPEEQWEDIWGVPLAMIPLSLILGFPGWVSGYALCSHASGVLCLYLTLRLAWLSDAFPCPGYTIASPSSVLHFFSFCLAAVHSCLSSHMCAGMCIYMCVHTNVHMCVEAPG